ncbi:DUF4446 family protein [Candidatus Daviesbacteria bacterium]|nr:DUF4446 family protein [Candidatus Daviesbacteria bacterium]
MYPDGAGAIFLGLAVIWLLGLSWLVWQQRQFLKRLFPKNQGDFGTKLEEVLTEVGSLESFKAGSRRNFHKMALIKYNPYQDTGGSQSFSLALLDSFGDGVVITSLHSRSGTRVFAKAVKGGGEESIKFSAEEREAVEKALRS